VVVIAAMTLLVLAFARLVAREEEHGR
jgi:hypothetical protein